MATILSLPTHYGPARPTDKRRKASAHRLQRPLALVPVLAVWRQNKNSQSVPQPALTAKQQAYQIYLRASEVDETDPHAGIEMYEQALALDSELHIARTNMGNCYHRTGREHLAMACYTRAIEQCPTQPEALYNLGYLELEQGQYREAISLFQRALESDPNFADAWFNLGCAWAHIDSASSIACFRRYIQLEPKSSWAEIARRHLPSRAHLSAVK